MTAPVMDTTSIVPNSDDVPSDMFERVIRALNVAYFEWSDGNDKVRVSAALADLFGLRSGHLHRSSANWSRCIQMTCRATARR